MNRYKIKNIELSSMYVSESTVIWYLYAHAIGKQLPDTLSDFDAIHKVWDRAGKEIKHPNCIDSQDERFDQYCQRALETAEEHYFKRGL